MTLSEDIEKELARIEKFALADQLTAYRLIVRVALSALVDRHRRQAAGECDIPISVAEDLGAASYRAGVAGERARLIKAIRDKAKTGYGEFDLVADWIEETW